MSLPIAFQISITGFVLCVTMIQLISVGFFILVFENPRIKKFSFQISPLQNFTLFILYVSYIICMLIQVYLQCYFGSRAIHGSAKLTTAAFSSNWLEIDIGNRKLLNMFMVRMREPCRIKTMRIFSMDLSTFTSVGDFNAGLVGKLVI